MFKKIFYSLTILAMLVGMFGVAGKGGVQSAAALPNYGVWADQRPVPTNDWVDPPNYRTNIDMSTADNSLAGNMPGCDVGPTFGSYQLHTVNTDLWLDSNLDPVDSYVRVRVEGHGNVNGNSGGWAVFIGMNDTNLTQLGCAVAFEGVVDLTVLVPAESGYVITLANIGVVLPWGAGNLGGLPANYFESWILQGDEAGGGLIVDMSEDVAPKGWEYRAVEASGETKAYIADVTPDLMAYFDIPAGTYNLGIQDQSRDLELAVYVDQVDDTYIALDPTELATEDITVTMKDEKGAPLCLFVAVNTNASLLLDLELGLACLGDEVAGEKTFMVNPGPWGWDVTAYIDNQPQGPDYFLVERDINTLLGDVVFNLKTQAHQKIHLCYPGAKDLQGDYYHGYLEAWLLGLDPSGNLMPRDFEFTSSKLCDSPECGCPQGSPNVGQDLFLTAGALGKLADQPVFYDGMQVCLEGDPKNGTGDPHCGPIHIQWIDKMPIERSNATQELDLAPALAPALAPCLSGTRNGDGICAPYCDSEKINWLYYFVPTVDLWDFAGSIGVHKVPDFATIFGETPFITEIDTSAVFIDAPGTVILTRGPWTDQKGNIIVRVLGPDRVCDDDEEGLLGPWGADSMWFDDVFPVDTLKYGVNSEETLLANDWLTTSFTVASKIGRYNYVRTLNHGYLPGYLEDFECCGDWPPGLPCGTFWNEVGAGEFAITPTDVHYGADWAFHFIMTNYEVGLTGGITATAYGPYLNVNRDQMASFLANGFEKIAEQTLPSVYANAFTDVPSNAWYALSVQYIKNLGITGGTGGGLYSPNSPVIRGDMAIFLEKTGQAISMIDPGLINWDTGLGTWLKWPRGDEGYWFPNTPGIFNGWFTDIAADAYYGPMAEEALADGLTGGCYAGQPYLDLKFCPTLIVDRSQMAVFLGNTWSLDEAPWWWVLTAVPAPEK
jgi:hypothetical protein